MKEEEEDKTLKELFEKYFPDTPITGQEIEAYEIENRSNFSQALLTNILRELHKDAKYQRLKISAEWNPTQTVEVEPPDEEPSLRTKRTVDVIPTKK